LEVYVDKSDRVWVIDFNPFGLPTCPLLFEWNELLSPLPPPPPSPQRSSSEEEEEGWEWEFRVVESEELVLQSSKGASRGPIDIHLASDFPNFLEICKAQQKEQEEEGRL
jgi:hypothetical protein